MQLSKSPSFHFLIYFIKVSLFLYLFTKANVASFTHDECYSYLAYCQQSFLELLSFQDYFTNNHILNSIGMKYSEQLFGNSELALRLPNLLALVLYLSYSFLLFKKNKALFSLLLFVLLCTNPLFMDFFSLARGYGLSYGFMLMSLYHFIAFLKNYKTHDLVIFHGAALLASLSNFTLLTYYASLIGTYTIVVFIQQQFILQQKANLLKINLVHFLPLLCSVVILYEPVRRLLSCSSLDFGGKNGFYADTVTHFINNTFHGALLSPSLMLLFQGIFTMFILVSFGEIIRMTVYKRSAHFFEDHLELIVSNLIFIIIALIIIGQHLILGADYPIARFSLFLLPIFIIHFGFLCHYLMRIFPSKVILALLSSLALVSLANFGRTANLYKAAEWAYDMETKYALQALMEYRKKHNDFSKNRQLGVHWIFAPSTNFYRKTQAIHRLHPIRREENIPSTYDYYYIRKKDLTAININYEVIKEYHHINTILVKNKQ